MNIRRTLRWRGINCILSECITPSRVKGILFIKRNYKWAPSIDKVQNKESFFVLLPRFSFDERTATLYTNYTNMSNFSFKYSLNVFKKFFYAFINYIEGKQMLSKKKIECDPLPTLISKELHFLT